LKHAFTIICVACLASLTGCTTTPSQKKPKAALIDAHGSIVECSPITNTQNMSQARKKAVLKAQGRITRTHNLFVYGEEHTNSGLNGTSQYHGVIEEESFGYLRPIIITTEAIIEDDKTTNLCVTVKEQTEKDR